MAEFVEDTIVYPTLIQMVACLGKEITDSGLPEPCFIGVLPGSVVSLDYCGAGKCDGTQCGGQAWARVVDVFPSSQFPTVNQDESNCGQPLAFRLEVGIGRCVPVGTNNAIGGFIPPTLEQQLDATRLQLADMAAMRRAISCCVAKDRNIDYVLEPYVPIPAQGGCGGGFWTVVIRKL